MARGDKLKVTIVVAFVLLITTASMAEQPPRVEWEKTFGGADFDDGWWVEQTSDGGYIVAGGTASFGHGMSDVYLIKTDASGNTIWERVFGRDNSEVARCVRQTSDGGYIVVGYTRSFGDGKGDVYLVKFDAFGNAVWERAIGGRGSDGAYSVLQTSDEGYIIVGHTYSFGLGEGDLYLIKTDAQGYVEWAKTYGTSQDDDGRSIARTLDGGYVITGTKGRVPYVGGGDVWLLKVDDQGNVIWERAYDAGGNEIGWAVEQTTDGGYIVLGGAREYGTVFLIKTDPQGVLQWQNLYNGITMNGATVIQTKDGAYVIGAHTLGGDAYLLKVGVNGDIVWELAFGGTEWDAVYCAQSTLDDGYIAVGETYSFGAGQTDVYLVKFKLLLDATPPALVRDFQASDGEDGRSTLTWTNPPDDDLAEVVVRRKTSGYPADHTDGDLVYQNTSPVPGQAISYTDTGLTNGTIYYYAVFSRDTYGNWNNTVQQGRNADIATPQSSTGSGSLLVLVFDESGKLVCDSTYVSLYKVVNGFRGYVSTTEVDSEGKAIFRDVQPGEYEIRVDHKETGYDTNEDWGGESGIYVHAGDTTVIQFHRSLPYVTPVATEVRFDSDGYLRALVTAYYTGDSRFTGKLSIKADIYLNKYPSFNSEYESVGHLKLPDIPAGGAGDAQTVLEFPRSIGTYYWAILLYAKLPNGEEVLTDCVPFSKAFSLTGKILEVPYYYQYDASWCALASMAMIFRYYGECRRMETLAAELRMGHNTPYPSYGGLIKGLKGQDIGIDWAQIRNALDSDRPVFLKADFGLEQAHDVVIVGYATIDDGQREDNILFLNDPSGYLWLKKIYPGEKATESSFFPFRRRFIAAPVRFSSLKGILSSCASAKAVTLEDPRLPSPPEGTVELVEPISNDGTSCIEGVISGAGSGRYVLYYDAGIKWRFFRTGVSEALVIEEIPIVDTTGDANRNVISLNGYIYNNSWSLQEYTVAVRILSSSKQMLKEFKIDKAIVVYPRSKDTWLIWVSNEQIRSLPQDSLYYLEIVLFNKHNQVCDVQGPIPFKRDIDTVQGANKLPSAKAGSTITVTFDSALPITKCTLTFNKDVGEFWIHQVALTAAPQELNARVYKYLEFSLSEPQAVEGGWLYFQVLKSWLSENTVNVNQLKLAVYVGGETKWEMLRTEILAEDETNAYYRAYTKHFSLFAICALNVPTTTRAAVVIHGPNPVPPEGCIFWLNLPDDAVEATLKIFDVDGALLVSIPLDPMTDRYPQTGRWIPRDAQGRLLGTGLYLYLLEIVHSDGRVTRSPVQKMVIQR